MVQVSFADGSTDFLLLNKYEGLDGHFIGHLENEPDACVAMVNHPEHSELTIMSNRKMGSSMFKWNKNGIVEVIPEIFSNGGGQKDIVLRENIEQNDDDELVGDQETQNKLNEIEQTMTDEQAANVPVTAKLQVKVNKKIYLLLGFFGNIFSILSI